MAKTVSWRLTTLLILSLLIAGGYWYRLKSSTCPAPLAYAIGTIDPRFHVSQTEVQALVSDAEATWEEGVGRDLFVYDPSAKLTINFVFDTRQELTQEELHLKEVLDQKEEVSSEIKEQYTALLSKYEDLKRSYEIRVKTYEEKLSAHNSEVAQLNGQGGAPPEVYVRLNAEQESLRIENQALGTLAKTLNGLVDSINTIGAKGNQTVKDYNTQVTEYNTRFDHEREFTQGDYYQGRINIYQFKDKSELRLVLAHELGHALSLGHVEGDTSIMYYLMGGQPKNVTLSPKDIGEFRQVCGAR